MRLRIIEVNFTNKHEWLFKLYNESEDDFYIMNDFFYKTHNIKNPITKKELDYYDRGHWITANVVQINGRNIVIA